MTGEQVVPPEVISSGGDCHVYLRHVEVIRRLSLNGYTAYLIDPGDVVPNPDPGGGGHVTVVRSLNEIPV